MDAENKCVRLMCDSDRLIEEFNKKHKKREVELHPEFGNWQVEGIPAKPYECLENPDQLLKCLVTLKQR
jgi:hypothetical protein